MNLATEFDIAPLTWVRGEIDRALTLALEALTGAISDAADRDALRLAHQHIHQVQGALAVVGLAGATQFAESLDALAGDLAGERIAFETRHAQLLRRATVVLGNYLSELENGAPHQPLRLYPLYAELALARGLDQPARSALFFPDLSARALPPAVTPKLDPARAAKESRLLRVHFEKGLLTWLRAPTSDAGTKLMQLAIARLAQINAAPDAHAFWWASSAFFDGLVVGAIAPDREARQLCRRIDAQMRRLLDGTQVASERLICDVLFHVADARVDSRQGRALREAFRLDALIPAHDAAPLVETPLAPLRRALYDAFERAQEAWDRFAAGTAVGLPQMQEHLAAAHQPLAALHQGEILRLVKALERTANWLRKDPLKSSDALAMDVATALLVAELAVDAAATEQLALQMDALIARLAAREAGHDPGELDDALFGETSRHAREKRFFSQITREILATLVQAEHTLDVFFRNPAHRESLAALSAPLKQVEGAFTILGENAAAALVRENNARIDEFIAAAEPDALQFEMLAHELSALGFFVEALGRGPATLDRFLAPHGGAVAQQTPLAVREGAVSETLREDLVQSHEAKPEQAACAALVAPKAGGAAAVVEEVAAGIGGMPVVPEAPLPPGASIAPADGELLAIFIEEACEVLQTLRAHCAAASEQPHERENLVTLRRGFHTLKGSSRMLGLADFADAAKSIESALNRWLQQERAAAPQLLALIDRANSLFGAWVEQIGAGGGLDASELIAQADRLQNEFDILSQQEIAPAADDLAAPIAEAEAIALEAEPDVVRLGELAILRPLFELYLIEAGQHVAQLRDELPRFLANPRHVPQASAIRAAHTLGGISATLRIDAVHALARALEHALVRLHLAKLPPTRDQAELLCACGERLRAVLAEIGAHAMPRATPELLAALEPVGKTNAAAPTPTVEAVVPPVALPNADGLARDDIDEQLLPAFFDEAAELSHDLAAAVCELRASDEPATPATAIARLLHTLKGSARMAGAITLGEYVHGIEHCLLQACAAQQFDPDLADDLDASLDTVGQMIVHLRTSLPDAAAHCDEPVTPSGVRILLRVHGETIDRCISEVGEIAIARTRIEGELRMLRRSMLDLTDNVVRLRSQLREVEIAAESRMPARVAVEDTRHGEFDPLELDRFTRFQEVARMMAESVGDVTTIQQSLLKNLDAADATLHAQGRLARDLQQTLMGVRRVPFDELSGRLHRVVRQTAKELGKRVKLDIRGGQIEIDRSVLDKMTAPIEHMLRNAVVHGLEAPEARRAAGKDDIGQIVLAVALHTNEVSLELADDGRGLDRAAIQRCAEARGLLAPGEEATAERLAQLIFEPGFTTADTLSAIAGRGVGMDVVRSETQGLGGRIEVASTTGQGARFIVHLPLARALVQALLVRALGRSFAIPSGMIEQVLELRQEPLDAMRAEGAAQWQDRRYPLYYLPRLLGDYETQPLAGRFHWVLLLRSDSEVIALHVDELCGNQEIVVKNAGPQFARLQGFTGATVLPDGEVSLILDPLVLAGIAQGEHVGGEVETAAAVSQYMPSIMVVDDSLTVRKIATRLLEREGYRVLTAKDGIDALEQLIDCQPDVMLLDIEMPRMDGFDLARNIRTDERLRALPIIMITSRMADKHRNYAFEIGVNHYLGKPYDEGELLGLIAGFVRR